MSTIHKILMITSLSLLLPSIVSAQSVNDVKNMSPEDRRVYMESMSEDERAAMREKWRAEFENLSDEEKQALREQHAGNRGGRDRTADREAMRARWESMSEEERAAAKERHQAKIAERRQKWESMSEEERAAAREMHDERKGHHGEDHHKEGSGSQREEQPES